MFTGNGRRLTRRKLTSFTRKRRRRKKKKELRVKGSAVECQTDERNGDG